MLADLSTQSLDTKTHEYLSMCVMGSIPEDNPPNNTNNAEGNIDKIQGMAW
jgi:hypothetical protein